MKLTLALVIVLCVLGAIALPLFSKSGSADDVATITRLEQEGLKADLANDTSWAKKYLADDYAAGTSFGDWETKDSQLKDAADTANNKTNTSEISNMKVNVYGNTAIARFTNNYDDMHHGEHRSRKVICTDTWVKMGGNWKEVADHCSQAK